MSKNPLGENTVYPLQYEPDILHQIPRLPARLLLDVDKKIKMYGFDHWHAYEISWLDSNRKPNVGIGELFFSADSKNIIDQYMSIRLSVILLRTWLKYSHLHLINCINL